MDNKQETISHIKGYPGNWVIQTNDVHQQGVAALAEHFAEAFGMGEWGKVLGLMHDIGKEKYAFQQHIMKESGYQPDITVEGDSNHSYVGGLVAHQLFPQTTSILSNIIMGHHRGLYDDGEWKERMKQEIPLEVSIPNIKAQLQVPTRPIAPVDVHHIVRMLYSCLVDADYLDTEAFMMPEQSQLRGSRATMHDLCLKLECHLEKLNSHAPDTEVNRIRRFVQQCCKDSSDGPVDYYSLTVPTGGGKTLSSLLWALRHAVKNDLQRIIIAIPYTSIIVQTAATLKAIFGEENVLEHHSNVEEDGGNNEITKQLQLASENWDYPIVVTTNVRFFESLFSNKPSQCRKLHNIAKSVVIFDEVQTLPLEFLQPIINTFKTLRNVFGTSFLFTTASQPILDGTIRGTNRLNQFEALPQIHEIIPAGVRLHDKLRRVELEINNAPQSYDDVAKQIAQHDRVLCIVNTRKDAKELFERLPQEGLTLHLSRMMCPAHVKQTIEMIKTALKDDKQKIIRVIATQLIEAGVDIDFPVVYRQEAGLDSILQAAGRCNREGKHDICTTRVFSLGAEHQLPPGYISQSNNARLNLPDGQDWFAPETMRAYFAQLFARTSSFDKKQIGALLNNPSEMQFEEAASLFHLIDDETTSVYVKWGIGKHLIEELQKTGPHYSILKKLSQYAVNVRQRDFQLLNNAGVLSQPCNDYPDIYILDNESFYDDKIGLVVDNKWLEETFII